MDRSVEGTEEMPQGDDQNAHRELDDELYTALQTAHRALVDDLPLDTSTAQPSNDYCDPHQHYWPASTWDEGRSDSYSRNLFNTQLNPSSEDSSWRQRELGRMARNNNANYRVDLDREPAYDAPREDWSQPPRRPLPIPSNDRLASVRADLTVRNTLRELITTAVLSDTLPAPERAAMLDDCRAQAQDSQLGVPFCEILSEPMGQLGVPPLLYELMSCQPDWEGVNDEESGTGMEVVQFLIEHWQENVTAHYRLGSLSRVVRTGCLRRFNEEESNRLFQQLRPTVFEKLNTDSKSYVEYDISVTSLASGDIGTRVQGSNVATMSANGEHPSAENKSLDFCAFISVPDFANRLAHLQVDTTSVGYGKRTSRDHSQTRVRIEFFASKRAWSLEIDSNALKVELLDGPEDDPGLYVDARAMLVAPENTNRQTVYFPASSSAPLIDLEPTPIELLLPRVLLRPLHASGRGTHAVSLSPCFTPLLDHNRDAPRGFDDPRYLHDGTLLMELTVRLSRSPTRTKSSSSSSFYIPPLNPAPVMNPVVPQQLYPPRALAQAQMNTEPDDNIPMATTEKAAQTESAVYSTEIDDDDDLYIDDEPPTLIHEKSHEFGSDADSDWVEINDDVDMTEEKEGGWVKASYSGKDKDL